MLGSFIILLVGLSIVAAPTYACSPPRFWNEESLQERLLQATVAFRGKVTGTSPQGPSPTLYQATFEVACFYKGLIDYGPKTITIGDIGWDGGLCVATEVEVGKDYIIFADMYGSSYLRLANINLQSGATEATPSTIAEVEQSYRCMVPGE